MGGSKGVRTPLAESALFCRRVQFSTFVPLLLETPKSTRSLHKTKIFPRKGTCSSHKTKHFPQKRHSFIAQNQTFSPEKKMLFLQLEKTWNLIPRCQENAPVMCALFPPSELIMQITEVTYKCGNYSEEYF
jgi:hypothetical protein